jgi:hypothetical protein
MRIRSIVGVLVGGVTDILATNLFTIPLVIYVMATHDLQRQPSDQSTRQLVAVMHDSTGIQIATWVFGLCASAFGGYIAARIAQRDEVKYGALSSWLCIGFGIYGLVKPQLPLPWWQHLLAFVLSPLCGALGGYLRLRQARPGDEGPPEGAVVPMANAAH